MSDKPAILRITANASEAAKAVRTPKEGPICTVKEGSQIALWSPYGFPEALIIAHPDDPPRLVYFDGTEEELTMKDGTIFLPPVVVSMPNSDVTFDVGTFDGIIDWSEQQDPESWTEPEINEGGTEPLFRDDAQAAVNEYFNERIYEAPELTEEGRDNVRRVLGEMVLGKPRWTEAEQKNARRVCPTCGTPACNHPDRIRGEDALPIPPEALAAGGQMVQNFLPQYEWRTCEAIAEGIFREMLEKCSK